MQPKNPTQKPRYQVVYQAWTDDERPALALTSVGRIAADDIFSSMVRNRLVKDCNCPKKGK